MHFDGVSLEQWIKYGSPAGRSHFTAPLHACDYEPEIKSIFPEYKKGSLPADFVSWASLRNLKANFNHQPTSNPHSLQGIYSFAEFLIREIEKAYPGALSVA